MGKSKIPGWQKKRERKIWCYLHTKHYRGVYDVKRGRVSLVLWLVSRGIFIHDTEGGKIEKYGLHVMVKLKSI